LTCLPAGSNNSNFDSGHGEWIQRYSRCGIYIPLSGHTSGAGIFSYIDTDDGTYGIHQDKIYNDWEGIKEITTVPDHAFYRNVDKIVLEAGESNSHILRAAIISPTTVFGTCFFSINW
jgi:hypothetical protein